MKKIEFEENGEAGSQREFLQSHYNFFVKRKDGVMVFNARKGSFTLVSEEIANLLQGNGPIGCLDEPDSLNPLLEVGVLHLGGEYDDIVALFQGAGANTKTLSVAIVPTMSCNLRCGYCYQAEYRHDRRMTKETQEHTLSYIRTKLRQGWKEVDCTWYGGEPLLEKNIVLDMSDRLQQLVKEEGAILSPMSMVTNGTLLDEDTAKNLAKVGVKSIQISLDSLFDDGLLLRGALNPDGNLSKIINNIILARLYMKIQIRINVSASRQHEVDSIMALLREHDLCHLVSLERVTDLEAESGAAVDKAGSRFQIKSLPPENLIFPAPRKEPDTLTRKSFAKLEQDLIVSNKDHINKIARKLTPKSQFCGATLGNLFVIDADGDISRCWHSAGSQSESIGNVRWEDGVVNQFNNDKWNNISPFLYSSCSSCTVLPLCMGGCSHPRVFMGAKSSPCESIKYQIQACVDVIGSHLQVLPSNQER